MQQTPFQYLIANKDKLDFECPKEHEEAYRNAVVKSFEYLDKYFTKNNLYEYGDYLEYIKPLIDPEYIEDKFKFTLFSFETGDISGNIDKHNKTISIKDSFLSNPDSAPILLSHELIHFLTIIQTKLKFIENGYEINVWPTSITGGTLMQGNRNTYEIGSHKKIKTEPVEIGVDMTGSFLNEGLTEFLNRKIHNGKNHGAYAPHIHIIELMNQFVDEKDVIKEFLQGDLPTYKKLLGKNFYDFFYTSNTFHKEYAPNSGYANNANYLKTQSLVIESILNKLEENFETYKPSEIAQKLAFVLSTDLIHPEIYQEKFDNVIKNYIEAQKLPSPQTAILEQLMHKTINQQIFANKQIFPLGKTGFSVRRNMKHRGDIILSPFARDFEDGFEFEMFSNKSGSIEHYYHNSKSKKFEPAEECCYKKYKPNGFITTFYNADKTQSRTVDLTISPEKIIFKENGTEIILDFETITKLRKNILKENYALLDTVAVKHPSRQLDNNLRQ